MNKTRRTFLGVFGASVVSIPLGALTGTGIAADLPRIDPQSEAAKALAYTHQSTDAARNCAGCQFFTEPDAAWGHCVIFPDSLVSAEGVCNSWFARV